MMHSNSRNKSRQPLQVQISTAGSHISFLILLQKLLHAVARTNAAELAEERMLRLS